MHVRLPEPIYDTLIVRPMVQQGVPIDHPEVQTPSGVTEAGQKTAETI